MKRYITNENHNLVSDTLEFQKAADWAPVQIRLNPQMEYQKIIGLGGALTEASAYVWSQMSKENQEKLIDLYFSRENSAYNFCRLHIQSCDFALGNYSYVDNPEDKELKSFSIERDKKYIIPFVKAALAKNPDIEFLASPWSPPAFMKTNNEMNHGGNLKKEFYQMWADVFVKYLLAYREEEIVIKRLTVQNEPAAVQSWDSCIYSAEEERDFACDYLKPALVKAGLGDVKINVWDHNKEILVQRASGSLSTDKALASIDGIAFHWYAGDFFESVAEVNRLFPDKELIFSEGCVEYSNDKTGSQTSRAERYAHDMIGNFNNGTVGFTDWNVILDSEGGPNHVNNLCDAPVMCHYKNDNVDIHKSYYYIRHFSQFIQKGAVRIWCGRSMDKVESVAFKNPDGSLVCIILNKSDVDVNLALVMEGKQVDLSAGKHSIQTVII